MPYDPLGLNKPKTPSKSVSSYDPLNLASYDPLHLAKPVQSEEDKSDLLQAGAGVLEGILDPLSIIPFVDRKLQTLRDYRGDSPEGRIGYGVGAIGSFFIPLAPANLALRAGTATAKGLKLVKAVEESADIANLAGRMVNLSRAGQAVQGAVAGGLTAVGMPVEEGDSRILNTLEATAFGGVADIALSAIWRPIAAMYRASKTVAPELKKLAEETLRTGVENNAPVVTNTKTSELIGRAMTLADHVLGDDAAVDDKIQMGISLARVLKSQDEGTLRIIPAIGRNHSEFVNAVKELGLEVVEAKSRSGGENVSDFLIGEPGVVTEKLAEEFGYYGFIKGQSAVTGKFGKGTIVGLGEKEGSVKMLFAGKGVKEVQRDKLLMLPVGYNKGVKRSIPQASALWSDFLTSYESQGSSPSLDAEARKLGVAIGDIIPGSQKLSFDGAFEKFVKDKKITGAQSDVLKDYFVKRQTEDLKKIAGEEVEILNNLRAVNKDLHPDGALVENAAIRQYKVIRGKDEAGKELYSVRDIESGQVFPAGTKEDAAAFIKNHQRDAKELSADLDNPVFSEVTNVGGVSASIDEAGAESMLSPAEIEKINRSAVVNAGLSPRAQVFRFWEDTALKEGKELPVFSRIFDPVARARVLQNNAKVPYLQDAVKIVGKLGKRNIRPEMHEAWVALMETPKAEWQKVSSQLGLNEREIKSASNARELFDRLWEKEAMTGELDITAEDYISNYWPRMKEFGKLEDRAQGTSYADYIRGKFAEKNLKVSDKAISFFSDLDRSGQLTRYETDPLAVMSRYINGITYKKYAKTAFDTAEEEFKKIVGLYKNDKGMQKVLVTTRDYLNMAKGASPEETSTIRTVFQTLTKNMGLDKHMDEDTLDRFAAAWVGLNHGSFMAFRLAKSVMNFTQLGHVYIKDGAKYMARGIVNTLNGGGAEALKEGAVVTQGFRLPMYGETLSQKIAEGKIASEGFAGKILDAGLATSEFGGKLFNKVDDWLRSVAYHSQKSRAIDAWNNFAKFERNEAFEEAAGLTAHGEVVTQEYFKVLKAQGNEAAAKWLGVRAANDTQWMYQTGAGPIAFSKGSMKLFGQYGTWPTWYYDFAKRGLTVGTKNDKAKFVLRTAAMSGALAATGYATGVNTVRWHGFTSMFFAGGPAWEKAKDISTIWGGVGRPEGAPLETRMTLAKYGISYDEDSPLHFGIAEGGAGKLFKNTIGLATPGMGAIGDVTQAKEVSDEGGSLYDAVLVGLGFDLRGEESY